MARLAKDAKLSTRPERPSFAIRARAARRPRVVFLYRAAHESVGSKKMRCDQLCSLAQRRLGDDYAFETQALPRPKRMRATRLAIESLKDAIVILLKQTHKTLPPDAAAHLRDVARAVFVDYVDAPIDGSAIGLADVHIAASPAAFRRLTQVMDGRAGDVRYISHHADPRIAPRRALGGSQLRIAYFGDRRHLNVSPTLQRSFETAWTSAGDGSMERALRVMRRADMHFAVRTPAKRPNPNAFKPFTKGFNAASANANILINRDAPEVADHLGDDYPFLIDSARPRDVMEGVLRAKDAFGSREWRNGLEHMAALRAECAPDRIAGQLSEALLPYA